MSREPYCPKCGYTARDAAILMDHHLCSGKIPKRRSRGGIQLDKDGRPKVLENEHVRPYVRQYLETRGWIVFETDASNLKRSGAPAFAKNTLDMIALKGIGGAWKGNPRVIILELKRRFARTDKERLRGQTLTAEMLAEKFEVYQAPENHPDPIGHFTEWARQKAV